jgi:hypothetical protein
LRPQGTAYVLIDPDPDYAVVGETRADSQQAITRAIRLLAAGPGSSPPTPTPPAPPQPATVLIGNQMDTDIVAGLQAGSRPFWS